MNINAFLQLIRFPNLIIVALTQYLMRYCIIEPALKIDNVTASLDIFHFFLLVLSTVLIAAGGYVINDIADYEIDKVNKPDKLIIDKYISISRAQWLYHGINLLGFFISLYLAFYVQNIQLVFIYPIAVVLLWLYSYYLKKMLLTGNVVVALFCAFVAVIVLFAERFILYHLSETQTFTVLLLFLGYAVFAYLSTMFREIIKDIEDIQGDHSFDCATLPIVLGVRWAKIIAAVFAISLLLFLAYASVWLFKVYAYIDLGYIIIGIILPIVYALFLLYNAKDKTDFHRLSQLAKYIMLSGILYLPIYSFL